MRNKTIYFALFIASIAAGTVAQASNQLQDAEDSLRIFFEQFPCEWLLEIQGQGHHPNPKLDLTVNAYILGATRSIASSNRIIADNIERSCSSGDVTTLGEAIDKALRQYGTSH